MKNNIFYSYFLKFVIGLLFGFGLIVSQMYNPKKVLDFLNIFGSWDPSLIFVMLGGIFASSTAFYLLRNKTHSFHFDKLLEIPKRKDVDRNLIFGAILFGLGWGIAGVCPGPALVGVGLLDPKLIFFTFFMIVGMEIFRFKN